MGIEFFALLLLIIYTGIIIVLFLGIVLLYQLRGFKIQIFSLFHIIIINICCYKFLFICLNY
jgi:NADH:ubiquinone oxidoreductase subunit 6 (subunit J)